MSFELQTGRRRKSELSRLEPEIARPLCFGALGALLESLLAAHLYLRSAPLGGAFALRPTPYLLRAIYYACWAHALVALPFVVYGYLAARGRVPKTRLTEVAQVAVTALLLVVGGLDREFQRFLGSHVTTAWLMTYRAVDHTPSVIWRSLAEDLGGRWSSLWGLALAALYAPLCLWLRSVSIPRRWAASPVRNLTAMFLLVVWPTLLWNLIPGGVQRQNKVRPALLSVLAELRRDPIQKPEPAELNAAALVYQGDWLAHDATRSWAFDDARYPLQKRYLGARPSPRLRPNFIVLSLETFRAKEMPSFYPAAPTPSATPFLDSLATSPDSASYVRHYASGVPTVFAFMSIHTGLLMHPKRNVPAEATANLIEGVPNVLRRHGYYTAHFAGSDPDWDGQRVWLKRWYDEIDYRAEDGERDRATFRRAAERIRRLGAEGKPFFAYLSSISNHTPFKSPEPALDIAPRLPRENALRNTMHYTDDVVRELYATLQNEPWFADTIWIITGDHGFDLGERGEVGGHDNLRHETTWVPLIIHGKVNGLPRGRQTGVSSHVDLAPTLSELASVYDDNAYMGHSLVGPQDAARTALILRGAHYAYEAPEVSLFRPSGAPAIAYAGFDLGQSHALSTVDTDLLLEGDRLARATRTVLAYAVDFNRHTPPPDDRLASHD